MLKQDDIRFLPIIIILQTKIKTEIPFSHEMLEKVGFEQD